MMHFEYCICIGYKNRNNPDFPQTNFKVDLFQNPGQDWKGLRLVWLYQDPQKYRPDVEEYSIAFWWVNMPVLEQFRRLFRCGM